MDIIVDMQCTMYIVHCIFNILYCTVGKYSMPFELFILQRTQKSSELSELELLNQMPSLALRSNSEVLTSHSNFIASDFTVLHILAAHSATYSSQFQTLRLN